MGRSSIAALAVALAIAGATALAVAQPPSKHSPPGPDKTKPKPSKPVASKHSSQDTTWLQQTNAICTDALNGRRRVLEQVRKKPATSARATLLEIRSGSVAIENRVLGRLAQVKPSRQAHLRYDQAVSLFRSRHAQDAALVKQLRSDWNARALERQQIRDDATNGRLAKDWGALGSSGCAAYFRDLRSR